MESPIIIIGAGRSGTNMLRGILTSIPHVGTWPCDEINYIWRHGNASFLNDELRPRHATKPIKKFIRNSFNKIASKQKIKIVVEKTCANSLRVSFVDCIVPDAKYMFIVRDGRDVAASVLKRWVAPLDIPYILKKARYVPFVDIPYYGSRYFWNRVYRLFSKEDRLSFWGPSFDGMREAMMSHTLSEVSAMQWVRSVEKAEQDFKNIDPARIYSLKYENFVNNPSVELQKIVKFLGIELSQNDADKLTNNVFANSVGKWHTELEPEVIEKMDSIIKNTMERYGYY